MENELFRTKNPFINLFSLNLLIKKILKLLTLEQSELNYFQHLEKNKILYKTF